MCKYRFHPLQQHVRVFIVVLQLLIPQAVPFSIPRSLFIRQASYTKCDFQSIACSCWSTATTTSLSLSSATTPPIPTTTGNDSVTSSNAVVVSDTCQLAQLSKVTTLSIDSGDIDMIQQYAATGFITDATTNPLFVAQTALKLSVENDPNSNAIYSAMVNDAVTYAVTKSSTMMTDDDPEQNEREIVGLAMDRLAVNLGKAIADIVPGYISTEVDPRLSFDIDASVQRGLRIIQMYEQDLGISKERVLIKLAATWEGIMAARILQEQYNIRCNLTLIFSVVQAIACGQYNVHLISPFPGRILDWYKVQLKRSNVDNPQHDEGVLACTYMYNYFKYYNHTTICMPASWRPSRGVSTVPGVSYDLDEVQALAGTDRMTIPVTLLEQLAKNEEPLPRILSPEVVKELEVPPPLMGNGKIDEKEFRYLLAMDGCGNDKLAEGLRSFVDLTEQLQTVMTTKVRAAMKN
jgi:transaldolase